MKSKEPTEKQVKCVLWIRFMLQMDKPEYTFDDYRKFISQHIEDARNREVNLKFKRLMKRIVRDTKRDY